MRRIYRMEDGGPTDLVRVKKKPGSRCKPYEYPYIPVFCDVGSWVVVRGSWWCSHKLQQQQQHIKNSRTHGPFAFLSRDIGTEYERI